MSIYTEDEMLRQRIGQQLASGRSVYQVVRSEVGEIVRQDILFDQPKVTPFTPIHDPGLDYVQTPFGWCRRGSERQANMAMVVIIAAIIAGFVLAFIAFGAHP